MAGITVHEIHGVHKWSGDKLKVLLNETKGGDWIFRREPSISFSESSLFLGSYEGIPYWHPAVVLLYKAKNARDKDHIDFFAVKNLLKREDKNWLCETLRIHAPGHLWIGEL